MFKDTIHKIATTVNRKGGWRIQGWIDISYSGDPSQEANDDGLKYVHVVKIEPAADIEDIVEYQYLFGEKKSLDLYLETSVANFAQLVNLALQYKTYSSSKTSKKGVQTLHDCQMSLSSHG